MLAHRTPERPVPSEPGTIIEMELLDVWRSLLATQDIGVDDDFFDSGGHAHLAADMLLEAQQRAGVSLDDFKPPVLTIRTLAEAIAERLAAGGSTSPAIPQDGVPLFLYQGDRGALGVYAHQLARLLRERRPVVLLNGPDDNAREIESVAAGYLPDVLSAGKSPVFLCGYCTAGLVVWQLAHLLRARGVQVAGLLLVETPSFNAGRGMRAMATVIPHISGLLPGRARVFVRDEAMRALWAMRLSGLRGLAVRWAQHLSGLGERAQRERHVRNAAMVLNNYRRVARYVPPRLDVPVTCVVATEARHIASDPSRWRKWAPEVRVLHVPGTHLTAVSRYRAELAAALERAMSAARQVPAPSTATQQTS